MSTSARKWIGVLLLSLVLGWPLAAHAQAPVVSDIALSNLTANPINIFLYSFTTWAGGASYNKPLVYTNLTQPANGVISWPATPGYANYYCTYTCTNRSFSGTDSFVWRCANGSQTSGLATFSIKLYPQPLVQPSKLVLGGTTTNFTSQNLGQYVEPNFFGNWLAD